MSEKNTKTTKEKMQDLVNQHKKCYIESEQSADDKEKSARRADCNKTLVKGVRSVASESGKK
jgi:hypothetical protein